MERARSVGVEPGDPFEGTVHWRAGAAAGLVAAAATVLIVVVLDDPTLRDAVAGLYGLTGNVLAGYVAHLVHGAVFGVVFAAILSDPALARVSGSRVRTLLAALSFAVLLAVFGAGVVMPIWLSTITAGASFPVPNVTGPVLLWHLVYGLVLGGLYPPLEGARIGPGTVAGGDDAT